VKFLEKLRLKKLKRLINIMVGVNSLLRDFKTVTILSLSRTRV